MSSTVSSRGLVQDHNRPPKKALDLWARRQLAIPASILEQLQHQVVNVVKFDYFLAGNPMPISIAGSATLW